MKHITSILLVLISFLAFSAKAQKSGWTQAKGELYAQASVSHFFSDKYYSVDGEKFDDINEFRQSALNLYAEYGLHPRLTAILNTSALRLNRYPTTNVISAPGDLQLGLKYAVAKKIPLSISVIPEVPLGKKDNFAIANEPNEIGIRERINLATTDGEFNVWSMMSISTPLPNGKGWASAFSGFNFRTKGFSHQSNAGLEVGFQPTENIYLKGTFETLISHGNPKRNVPFFRGEGTEMAAVSLGAGWQFSEKFGTTFTYWRNVDFLVGPKNAYVGPLLSFGIFYKHQP